MTINDPINDERYLCGRAAVELEFQEVANLRIAKLHVETKDGPAAFVLKP